LQIEPNKLYSIKELKDFFSVTESTLKRWMREGFPHKALGNNVYTLGASLIEFLRGNDGR